MPAKYANNARSKLFSGINASALNFSLISGGGASFPAAGGSDYFYATLIDAENIPEIVKVTSRTNDSFIVLRGQDGTVARAFAANAEIILGITKASLEELALKDGSNVSGTWPIAITGVAAGSVAKKGGDTGSAVMPAGPTSERPPTPGFGEQRANTTTQQMEWWNGIAWAALAEQSGSNRNKIINPFTENQRGLVSVADDTYCLDRWYVLTESGNVTVAQIEDPEPGAPSAIRLTQPDATPKRMGLATIIESKDIRQYRNTAMNFAGRVKPSFTGNVRYAVIEHTGTADVVISDVVNNWASATFTPGNFFIAGINILKTGTVAPGAATYGDFSDWVALGFSTKNVILFYWTEAAQAQGATLEANRPQYEPGVVRTPQEWRMNELQLCQRYFERVAYSAFYLPGTAATTMYIPVTWKVTKRALPSVTLPSSAGAAYSAGGVDITPTTWETNSLSTGGCSIFVASTSLGGVKSNVLTVSAEL